MQGRVGSSGFSAWIDAARWAAAASVLVTHTGIRMLVPVADMPVRSWPHLAYAFAAGFDHQAVMVFFVLSGLLVGGSVVREVRETGGFAAGPYLARRLVRLCVVLWPSFLLAALCTGAALALGGASRGIVPPDAAVALDLPVLLCNAAFLQTAACDQYAANGALWSLFNEFWYYVLFPPLALAALAPLPAMRRILPAALGLCGLALLTGLQFTGSPLGPYMLVWVAGTAAAALPRPALRSTVAALALFGAASLAVRLLVRRAFATDHPLLSAEIDLVLALLFANLLLTARHDPALRPPPWPALHRWLAGFSFSLYCTHVPLLVLLITLLDRQTGYGWQMSGTGVAPWLAVAAALATCVAAAWMFALATEAQTGRVRAALSALRMSVLAPR